MGAGVAPHTANPRQRRRRTHGFALTARFGMASSAAAERLHVSTFGRAYVFMGIVVIAVLFYLAVAAQITQSSYDIARLQDQQRQLIAEQDALRYQEVTMHAPAQVQQQATQSGLARVAPSTYVAGVEVAIDLTSPIGASPIDQTPLWLRAVAAVVNTVGGPRDVMAQTKK
jgi:hypothetical protein